MAHFFRCSVPLSSTILFIVFLLPFCQSKDTPAYSQLNTTMADEFTCPSGGQWYVCPGWLQTTVMPALVLRMPFNVHRYACPSGTGSSKFVGCCAGTADPCSTGCAQGNIRPAAFPPANYGKFPDATCGTNSDFFTCAPGGNDTFWGCCKSAPCSTSPPACPDGSLVPAFLDQPAQINFYAASQTGASSAASSEGGSKSNGAVIGGAVGGAIGGILIIGLIVFFLFRRRRSQQTTRGGVEVASPMMDGPKAFDPHSPNFAAQSRKYP